MRTHFYVSNRKFSVSSMHDAAALANDAGFFLLPLYNPWSSYQGMHFYTKEQEPLKIVDFLGIPDPGPPTPPVLSAPSAPFADTAGGSPPELDPALQLSVAPGRSITKTRPGWSESYMIGPNSLRYTLKTDVAHTFPQLFLDVRRMFDHPERGRIYEIREQPQGTKTATAREFTITYTQYRDEGLREPLWSQAIAIRAQGLVPTKIGTWEARHYPLDEQRKSRSDFYVYHALDFAPTAPIAAPGETPRTIVVAIGPSPEAALSALDEEIPHASLTTYPEIIKDWDNALKKPFLLAASMLLALHADLGPRRAGMRAGLPWFYHLWLRDELISLDGIRALRNDTLQKHMISAVLDRIGPDGLLPSHLQGSTLASADAPGLLFFALMKFLESLEARKLLPPHPQAVYTKAELSSMRTRMSAILDQYESSRGHVLVEARPLESWMDTGWATDVRSGACIELQALHLGMLSLVSYFDRLEGSLAHGGPDVEQTTPMRLHEIKEYVRTRYHADGALADTITQDGTPDKTARPNIFLAHHFFPDLFSQAEWKGIFDAALAELWLPWGGLSSISTRHPLFCPHYSGEDNRSYHRGDSWLFVNHIAALSMLEVDAPAYQLQISSILRASTQLLLSRGIAGSLPELSDASELIARGCPIQAWSLATYLSLLVAVAGRGEFLDAVKEALGE